MNVIMWSNKIFIFIFTHVHLQCPVNPLKYNDHFITEYPDIVLRSRALD